jgi:hypothetical protein
LFWSALFLLASVLVGVWLFRRSAGGPAFDRFIAGMAPVTGAIFLMEVVARVRSAPFWIWNDVRLARGIALSHGYRLYYDADSGPVIGTLHAPLGYLVYASLAFIESPAIALLAGSMVSVLLVFVPIGLIVLRASSPDRRLLMVRACLFTGCGLMLFRSPALTYSAFRIHSDAAALGFGALAAIFLSHERQPGLRRLLLSAIFVVLSIWSKQTMAPLMVALPFFVWMSDGIRQFWSYVVCLLGSGLAISLLLIAVLWPPQTMWFNIIVVPSHQPLKWQLVGRQASFSIAQPLTGPDAEIQFLSSVDSGSLLLAAIVASLLLYSLFNGEERPGFRRFVAANRWLVFTMVAVAMFPTFVLGAVKVGGDINHLSLIEYFVLLSAAAGLAAQLSDGYQICDSSVPSAAKVWTAILVLSGLPLGAGRITPTLLRQGEPSTPITSPSQAAYNYEKAHPGDAYFPLNPLAVLLAGDKLYHCDIGLVDRELAGFGIGVGQFRSHVPKQFRIVAFPPGTGPASAILIAQLRGAVETAGTGELAGWILFEPPMGETFTHR